MSDRLIELMSKLEAGDVTSLELERLENALSSRCDKGMMSAELYFFLKEHINKLKRGDMRDE